jgi:hypothetical protein
MDNWHYDFLGGAITMGYFTLGLFFLKFWKNTRDSFFLAFAGAFWLMAANSIFFIYSAGTEPEKGWTYLLRLAAFTLIIVAIIRKNIRTSERR